jgi:perosamine synthetase
MATMTTLPRVSEKAKQYVNEVLEFGFHNTRSLDFCGKLEQAFSDKFGRRFGILHANGTVTMQSALMAAGIGAGDEVIVPTFTVYMTASAVLYTNAVPVIADVDPQTWTIDPEDILRKITPRTKAIIPVSICGLAPDYQAILKIAKKHNLIIIEDNAQCFLGKQNEKLVGSFGEFASFSFQSSKHMTCGEGGILLCDDEKLAEQSRKMCSVGYSTITASPGDQTVPKEIRCQPDFTRHTEYGFNFRMSEMSAAFALGEFERLDDLVRFRQQVFCMFAEVASGCDWVTQQYIPPGNEHAAWTFAFQLNHESISWQEFRQQFMKLGGDGFYGAYLPLQHEPVFGTLYERTLKNPERYPHWDGILPDYREVRTPEWEKIQPNIVMLKTNYFDIDDAKKQMNALEKTLKHFS